MINFVVNGEDFEFEGVKGVSEEDIEMFLEPDSGDEVIRITADDLSTLAVEAKLFKSKGQARKAGFAGPIPWGINLFGTKKKKFWVWSPVKPTSAPTIKENFCWELFCE